MSVIITVLKTLRDTYGNEVIDNIYKRKQINNVLDTLNLKFYNCYFFNDEELVTKPKRGSYDLTDAFEKILDSKNVTNILNDPIMQKTQQQTEHVINKNNKIKVISSSEINIPTVDKDFIKWGYFDEIKTIIDSEMFFPIYIVGISGYGKTLNVQQACAQLKREYVRCQLTPESDSDTLIGGFRLIDGETVFVEGPVIQAMRRGAVLLIDECDRATNKIMCLQGVLEGKPLMIPQTGEIIKPSDGFNVIATANTYGRGDPNGKYSSASIVDEAFLERFAITIIQDFPLKSVLRDYINKIMKKFNVIDFNNEFKNTLLDWVFNVQKTFKSGGIDDVISMRRIYQIIQTYSLLKNSKKSIKLCLNRYEEETAKAFMTTYNLTLSEHIKNNDKQEKNNDKQDVTSLEEAAFGASQRVLKNG